ncbi:TPA: hypothetical protein DIC62_00335 [Candidatus Nomurabacteria bacterium]|nr:hypothetical protein [Candidatus Nomurabacteria bacterium]
MIKRYLNKGEREDVIIMFSFTKWLRKKADRLQELKRNKELIRFMRTAATLLEKVANLMIQNLDIEAKNQIDKESPRYEINCFDPGTSGLRARLIEEEKKKEILTEDFYDICDHALVICQECTNRGQSVQNCNMRKIFIRYEIEVFNHYTPEGICPYLQERYLKKEEVGYSEQS